MYQNLLLFFTITITKSSFCEAKLCCNVFVYNYQSEEIKNRFRSFQPQNRSKIKNNPGCPKKPGSYEKKKRVSVLHDERI